MTNKVCQGTLACGPEGLLAAGQGRFEQNRPQIVGIRRILRPEEIEAFKAQLSPHHIAKGHDGSTILERAVREHNVQAVAGLYTTIAFAQLGAILNITPEDAEEIVAELISRGSLSGSIDQAAGFASFSSDSALDTWDSSIAAICQDVNAIIAPIAERFPEFIES